MKITFSNLKLAAVAFLAAGILFHAVSDSAKADDSVRGVSWGSSAEQIRSAERSQLKRDVASGAVSYMVYADNYSGEPLTVVYRLINNQLFEVRENFETKGRSCAEMLKLFSSVRKDVLAAEGTPESSSSDEKCAADDKWSAGDTEVNLSLSGDSGRKDLALIYSSKSFGKLADQIKTVPAAPLLIERGSQPVTTVVH